MPVRTAGIPATPIFSPYNGAPPMPRTILTPALLPAPALADLKDWLAITTTGEDVPLGHLLRAALDLYESFTGRMALEATCEEVHRADNTWHRLTTLPVQAITTVEAIAADGARSPLPVADYAIDLDPDGGARVRVVRPSAAQRIAVRFTAGMASTWAQLPDAVRHGVIRLAADLYRDRTNSPTSRTPPAAVAALWRPWRRMQLA